MTKIPTHRRARGPLEIEIGKRIRAQRLLVGMTQRTLASAVGIAWQQVHKYERGISRIGASRLAAMADALDAPISYFFGDVLAKASQPMPNTLMEWPETLRLMRLYYAIRNETVRQQVLAIVEAVAEVTAPPSKVLEQDEERQVI